MQFVARQRETQAEAGPPHLLQSARCHAAAAPSTSAAAAAATFSGMRSVGRTDGRTVAQAEFDKLVTFRIGSDRNAPSCKQGFKC